VDIVPTPKLRRRMACTPFLLVSSRRHSLDLSGRKRHMSNPHLLSLGACPFGLSCLSSFSGPSPGDFYLTCIEGNARVVGVASSVPPVRACRMAARKSAETAQKFAEFWRSSIARFRSIKGEYSFPRHVVYEPVTPQFLRLHLQGPSPSPPKPLNTEASGAFVVRGSPAYGLRGPFLNF